MKFSPEEERDISIPGEVDPPKPSFLSLLSLLLSLSGGESSKGLFSMEEAEASPLLLLFPLSLLLLSLKLLLLQLS